ncbi:MAG: hypothetical protein HQ485_10275 [Acidobacteria bacterium]|mgnify:CR=1 FL=1|jgi:hypothetical protein|nr:hypothetical protein [Acidobacteriota bacterium]
MSEVVFDELIGQLEALLTGDRRQEYVEHLMRTSTTLGAGLKSVRLAMRTHTWPTSSTQTSGRLTFARAVQQCNALTEAEGFHALHDWDGIADHVNPEIIPVDVLDFVRRLRGTEPPNAAALSILIDYYAFHILTLLALRVWDTADPDAALGRVGMLLALLQGPGGSGQPFVADPETLLLIATSHYEPDERGYHSLLGQVRELSPARQLAVALGHASSMGAHLRFGFLATYARSTDAMREDNVADYPWLHYAADVVLREYERRCAGTGEQPAAAVLAEALLGSLTADTSSLVDSAEFRERLTACATDLAPLFESLAPDSESYSPLSLFFNFSHNLLKGTVVDAILRGDSWTVSYSDLLMGAAGGSSALPSRQALALTLMGYARRHPQRIRGQLMPVIVYDPAVGRAAHQATLLRLADADVF